MPSQPMPVKPCPPPDGVQAEFNCLTYLLERYGCRMTKRDVQFEAKLCRASIDNMRAEHHPSRFDKLRDAEVPNKRSRVVKFYTEKIAALLDEL